MISPNESLNDNFIRLLKERILERIETDKIVIFGSRARGDNKYNSDIDIAIQRFEFTFELFWKTLKIYLETVKVNNKGY